MISGQFATRLTKMDDYFRQYRFGEKQIAEFQAKALRHQSGFICTQNPVNFDPSDFTNFLRTKAWRHGGWVFYAYFWDRKMISIEDLFAPWLPLLDLIQQTDTNVAGLTRLYHRFSRFSLVTPNRNYFRYILRSEESLDGIHREFKRIAEAQCRSYKTG